MMQVTFCRPEACAACNACEGGKKEHSIWVRGEGEIGEIAIVEMPDRMVAKASFLAYGMPLALLLAGLILGHALTGGSDGGTAAGAAAGLACGMILLKMTEKNRRGREEWSPRSAFWSTMPPSRTGTPTRFCSGPAMPKCLQHSPRVSWPRQATPMTGTIPRCRTTLRTFMDC